MLPCGRVGQDRVRQPWLPRLPRLGCVLFEYVATSGLIDVSRGDPVDARRLPRQLGSRRLRLSQQVRRARRGTAEHPRRLGPRSPDRYEPVEPSGSSADVLANPRSWLSVRFSPAERASERVWPLSRVSVPAAIAAGRGLDEPRSFLARRARHDLPATVVTLLDDVEACSRKVRDLGVVRAVEAVIPRWPC